jgi:two-component system chemotaxis response regulator CheB
MSIRVLIVDDSLLMRTMIVEMIEREGDIKVVGTASNGLDALARIRELSPDVVTLDVEMPKLDGLACLKRIMTDCPARVIMLTGHRMHGGEETVRALELGAIDFVMKPSGSLSFDIEKVQEELRRKIRVAATVELSHIARSEVPVPAKLRTVSGGLHLVVIGASAGGPRALHHLLGSLPANLCAAVVVIQHMPESFTRPFAQHLNARLSWTTTEASEEMPLETGMIYVAPGGRHLDLVSAESGLVLRPMPASTFNARHVPSITYTMQRAAGIAGSRTIGVILTGMGDDGVDGLLAIRQSGGRTIAESEESAIVFGMPKLAAERGAAEFVLPLSAIAEQIVKLAEGMT